MSNSRFLAMKNRSDELNRKRQEIEWCLSTLTGIVQYASQMFSPDNTISGRLLGEQNDVAYFVNVMFVRNKPRIKITTKWLADIRPADMQWFEVDLFHDNLDTIIDVCEDFCRLLGSPIGFLVQMDRFRMK